MQTMRNVADSGGESGFNLEGLVSFSTYAVGVIGVLIGRFFFGLDWTVAAFDRRSQLYTYGLADEVLSASSPTMGEETVRRIREWERTSG